MTKLSNERLVEGYIAARDKLKEKKDAFAEECKPLQDLMEQIENKLLAQLNDTGSDSVKTKAGTFYRSTLTSASVKDWEALLQWVRENEAFGVLNQAVNKTAVKELNEAGTVVPGVVLRSVERVNIRR